MNRTPPIEAPRAAGSLELEAWNQSRFVKH
jgi:hypothetical protein